MKNTTYQKNDVWKWLRITDKYHNNIVDIVQFQGSDDNVYHYFPKTWELKLLADATQTEVMHSMGTSRGLQQNMDCMWKRLKNAVHMFIVTKQ